MKTLGCIIVLVSNMDRSIAFYREATGAGLAAAKEAVEALARGDTAAAATKETADSSLETEISKEVVARHP